MVHLVTTILVHNCSLQVDWNTWITIMPYCPEKPYCMETLVQQQKVNTVSIIQAAVLSQMAKINSSQQMTITNAILRIYGTLKRGD